MIQPCKALDLIMEQLGFNHETYDVNNKVEA